MKSKIFTKLLCLALCLVTILCSGCEDLYFAFCVRSNEVYYEKIFKEQEKILAGFTPEVTDYKIDIQSSKNAGYITTDELETLTAQGYVLVGFSNEGTYKYSVKIDQGRIWEYEKPKEITDSVNISVYLADDNTNAICSFSVLKKDIIGYGLWGDFAPKAHIEYDGKIFIITSFLAPTFRINYVAPPALFMIDMENKKLLYAGYETEYFEDRRKNDYQTPHDSFIKIEKIGEEDNEEN